MNDITALMATMKAAAIAVARDGRTDDEWFYYLQCVHHKNILALVEALEKREELRASANRVVNQQDIELQELRQRNAELVEALEKAQQKVDVYDMLREDYGLCEKGVGLADFVDWQAKRITSLKSRTVTVKLPKPLMPAQHNSGELFMTPDNVIHGGYLNRDDVLRNLRAAGIQVIEGEG